MYEVFNLIGCQGNANLNHDEIPLHNHQSGFLEGQ